MEYDLYLSQWWSVPVLTVFGCLQAAWQCWSDSEGRIVLAGVLNPRGCPAIDPLLMFFMSYLARALQPVAPYGEAVHVYVHVIFDKCT